MRLQDNSRWIRLITATSWTVATVIWVLFLATQQFWPTEIWLLDWHVYSAGAQDFLSGALYLEPLESVHRLPIGVFNYPPLSAIAAIPLLPVTDGVAGTFWVALNVAAVAATAVVVARILGARHPLLWGGLGFLAYTLHPWMKLAFLGNNTPLVLLLVSLFAEAHLSGRQRAAGVLLGAAIALKAWPLALVPLLVREGRWKAVAWTAGVVGIAALVTLARLGTDVIGPAIVALQARAPIEPDNPVLLVSWLRVSQAWWPWWGGFAVAVAILAVPARGRVGIGLGILAGLAPIPNLWRTYLPTLVVAVLLVLSGFVQWPIRRREAPAAVPSEQATRAVQGDVGR